MQKLNKTEQKIVTQIEIHGRTFSSWAFGVRHTNAIDYLMKKGVIERDGMHPDDVDTWTYYCFKGCRKDYDQEWKPIRDARTKRHDDWYATLSEADRAEYEAWCAEGRPSVKDSA